MSFHERLHPNCKYDVKLLSVTLPVCSLDKLYSLTPVPSRQLTLTLLGLLLVSHRVRTASTALYITDVPALSVASGAVSCSCVVEGGQS